MFFIKTKLSKLLCSKLAKIEFIGTLSILVVSFRRFKTSEWLYKELLFMAWLPYKSIQFLLEQIHEREPKLKTRRVLNTFTQERRYYQKLRRSRLSKETYFIHKDCVRFGQVRLQSLVYFFGFLRTQKFLTELEIDLVVPYRNPIFTFLG